MIADRGGLLSPELRTSGFGSTAIGDRLPDLVVGPITEVDVVRWCVAVENYHRIHYDAAFATGHEGLDAVIVNGPFKMAMLGRLLTGWLPPDARVRRIACRHRRPTYVGDSLVVTGEVASKVVDGRTGLLAIDLHLTNKAGEDVCPGSALVAFPLTEGTR